ADQAQTLQAARRAVAVADGTGMALARSYALVTYGQALVDTESDLEAGCRAIQQAVALAMATDAMQYAAAEEGDLAWVNILPGQFEAAEHVARRCLAYDTPPGTRASLRVNLGWALLGQTRHTEAMAEFAEAALTGVELADHEFVVEALVGLGRAADNNANPN